MFGSIVSPSGTYALPLNITLKTSVHVPENFAGVEITLSDGPSVKEDYGVNFTGTVFLPMKNVESAAIVVNPYFPGSGVPINDAELVWAGFCCAQTAKFTQMNSSLSLSYLDAEGEIVSFPSFYTFGTTGEPAYNLSVSQAPGGGRVSIGATSNTFLGS
jgi:hypothetical protein